jgi:hypothetical protein
VQLKADVGGMEWQGAPLVHPEAAGGCGGREGGRVGSTKVVVGQVLGGDEISSERPKNALGVWWVIPAGLVRKIARPGLSICPPKNFS